MSRTNLKRYLMLLGAIGLVAIAGGSSGTFASFNAEVTNSGNSFATGTLILNDNGGTNTCTSAIASSNNQNSSGSNCDTLFSTPSYIQAPRAALTTALLLTPDTTSLAFTAGLLNAGIDTGDTLTVTDPSGTCPTPETFTATQSVPAGTTSASKSVTVTGKAATCAFPTGSIVTDANATYYADLTLTNAGSLNASDIEFESSNANGCSDHAQEPTGTLSGDLSTGSAITLLPVTTITGGVPGGFADGDPIVITEGGNTQTFIVNGAQTQTDITSNNGIIVQSETPNFAYTSGTAIGGPSGFSGSTVDLCSNFLMSIQEMTDNTFSTAQSDCAFPSGGSPCDLDSGTALSALPNSFQALKLANPTFGHGTSDYFRLALKLPVSTLTNADQNKSTPTFGLTWHIDQA